MLHLTKLSVYATIVKVLSRGNALIAWWQTMLFPLKKGDYTMQKVTLPTACPDIIELGELLVSETATIEKITQAGKYDGHKPHIDRICQNFSITRRGPCKLFLAHFKMNMGNEILERVVAAIDDKELAPVEYLLAVGMHPKHKKLQLEFPIICRGSTTLVNGIRCVPCLSSYPGGRWLVLHEDLADWADDCRFLLIEVCPKTMANKQSRL